MKQSQMLCTLVCKSQYDRFFQSVITRKYWAAVPDVASFHSVADSRMARIALDFVVAQLCSAKDV